jgi:putative transposase
VRFRAHFPKDIMLMGVRWYVAYPLSTHHIEALLRERGAPVDHSTINRWVRSTARHWMTPFIAGSGPSGSVGGWMRHLLK